MTIDSWARGPTAADRLRPHGVAPREGARLLAPKICCLEGEVGGLADDQRRARFVRWLVEHGRPTDRPTPENTGRHGRAS
jgi:hypothetical protein